MTMIDASAARAEAEPALPAPPVLRKVPKITEIHGDRLVDDYFWLREKSDPGVAAYLEDENAYTAAVMKPTEALQEALYKEMLGHIKETDLSVPYKDGAHFYYARTEEGKQYPIYCRKQGSLDAVEEVTLDVNELAKSEAFMDVGAYRVSDDGNLLAYSTDNTGFRQYTLVVKDLRTGQLLPERLPKTVSVAWAADGKTLFYTVEDDAKRSYRLYRHRLGEPVEKDALLYEEKDELFRIGVGRSKSKAHLFLECASHTTSEVRFLRADRPEDQWTLVAPREHEHEYEIDHHDDLFYIRTNDRGRNFRLVTAPVADPRRESWQEVVAHRPEVMLEGIELFRHHVVLGERSQGLPRATVRDVRSGLSHEIAFPEPAYSIAPTGNREWDTNVLRYEYQSLVTPRSIFDYDMDARTATLLKETETPGYDRTLYTSDRIFAAAPDGTKVPLSVVHKKDRKRDGSAPLLLTGYGAYGIPNPVLFNSNRLALLDRGFAVAIAHVRGGGDLGKAWHDQGRMLNKKNTFTDFIACAEHLIAGGYTSPDRLSITGGSAGGLLMGAVVNMRPDLFEAVISHVPFVDVLNTMLDPSLPLTAGEWEEWGDPIRNKEHYDYIKSYCPCTNLAAKAYPFLLVETSFNDSQVMYWEPAKYVARLRTLKTDTRPLLLKTNMNAGHGGASGRYDYLREVAFDYAFLLAFIEQGGAAPPPLGPPPSRRE
jgi:oligopeptidase B